MLLISFFKILTLFILDTDASKVTVRPIIYISGVVTT